VELEKENERPNFRTESSNNRSSFRNLDWDKTRNIGNAIRKINTRANYIDNILTNKGREKYKGKTLIINKEGKILKN